MSELLLLDMRTLAFASAVSGFLMAATMFGIFFAGMRGRALVYWAMAGLAFGSGNLLGTLLQTLEVPIPGWVVAATANALIGLGHGLLLLGIQRYLGLPCWKRFVYFSVAVMFLSAFAFPEIRESLRLRVIVHSSWYVLVDAWAGWLLWRAHRTGMARFHRAAALVMFAFAGFLALRFGYALISPALTTSFVQDPFQIGAFLASMVFGFCITMALAVVLFRKKQVELLELAERDPLTGLYNRLCLENTARREIRRAREKGTPLGVILIDIDHFKQINDRFGHTAGDRALREIARQIGQSIRDSDIAFRFGGEEFLILLPGADRARATRVAHRLREAIREARLDPDYPEIWITASLGVAEFDPERESWEECLQWADQLLYKAKRHGRDRVQVRAPGQSPHEEPEFNPARSISRPSTILRPVPNDTGGPST